MSSITRKTIRAYSMRGTWLVLAGLALARFCLSQDGAPAGMPANPLAGSAVFIEKACTKCHAVLGFGESFGPDLTPIGQKMDFYQIVGALWSHSPKMIDVMKEKHVPRFVLTPDETQELVAFLYYLGFFETLGDFARGEEIFSKKSCGQCHALGGDKNIPLDKYGRYVSPVFIATELWNHSSSISASMSRLSFEPGEMSHLLAFIRGEARNPERDIVMLEPGSPRRGGDTFRAKKCSACHGEDGRGLKTSALRKGLTEIVGMMWNHSSEMWADMKARRLSVPRFSPMEMSDLIAFLYFLQFYGEKGDVPKGERAFAEKGCAFCHGPEGVGKKRGKDLTKVSARSTFEIVSAMWNHIPEMEKMVSEFNWIWPRFGGNEMRDLIFFIRSLKGTAAKPPGAAGIK